MFGSAAMTTVDRPVTPPALSSSAACRPRDPLSARLSRWAMEWSGSSTAFALAVSIVLVWLITGPFFAFSDTWQLVINTGTTVITFLMVFLIQRSQNKDSQAIHLKLNELLAASKGASNRLINSEEFTEEEIKILHDHFCKLVELAQADESVGKPHSVEEAAAC
jgi:low affinity Fe/Cu permease